MPRTLISSGSRFEAEIGYSRAVVQGYSTEITFDFLARNGPSA